MKRSSSPIFYATPIKRVRLDDLSSPISLAPSSVYQTPTDSPSNPFGRTLPRDPPLPPPTSFSRHLPLRFQVVRRSSTKPDVYRIVQVPLNYTFTHLRALIVWLFGEQAASEGSDHLFRAHKDGAPHKLGVFKPGGGTLMAKLSSARDPFSRAQRRINARRRSRSRSRSSDVDLYELRGLNDEDDDAVSEASLRVDFDYVSEDEEDDEQEVAQDLTLEPADEGDEWTWQAEEAYTVGHVFPPGGDINRGIIYEPPLGQYEIHISLNTLTIPSRRGRGNTPHVFRAYGRVNPDSDESGCEEEIPNSDDEGEPLMEEIDITKWNLKRPFTSYIQKYYQKRVCGDDDDRPVARVLFRTRVQSEDPEDVPPSSPLPASSSPVKSLYSCRSAASSTYSISFPAETPDPKHQLYKKRIEKARSFIQKHLKTEIELSNERRKEERLSIGKDPDKSSSGSEDEESPKVQAVWGDDLEVCPPKEDEEDDLESDGGDGWKSWDLGVGEEAEPEEEKDSSKVDLKEEEDAGYASDVSLEV